MKQGKKGKNERKSSSARGVASLALLSRGRGTPVISHGSFTLHGRGTGKGSGEYCSHCSGTRTGKYYARLFTCPRNHSICAMCYCFDHLTIDVTSLIAN